MRGPRIDPEPSRLAGLGQICLVEKAKGQAEAGLQFILPLQQHGRRAGHHDLPDLFPQQQLAGNQPGFDGLAEAHIITDEQIDTRQQQRFTQRLQLIRLQANPGPERRLKAIRIGRGQAIPAQSMQIGGKPGGGIETTLPEGRPGFPTEDLSIEFMLPQHLQRLALRVVIDASEFNQSRVAHDGGQRHILDQIAALTNVD